jgi:chromosome segregation ATPase
MFNNSLKSQTKRRNLLMPLISTQVTAAVATLIIGGTVFVFNGAQTIDNVKSQLIDFSHRIVQYEGNETTLAGKVRTKVLTIADLTAKVAQHETTISGLNLKVAGLLAQIDVLKAAAVADQTRIASLQANVTRIQGLLDTETAAHNTTKAALAALQTQYNSEVNAHNVTKQEKADAEAEIVKANEKVNELKVQSDAVAADTAGKVPLTQAEIDALEAVGSHLPGPLDPPIIPIPPIAPVDALSTIVPAQ